MKSYLTPIIAIFALLFLFFIVSRLQKQSEDKKTEKENKVIQKNDTDIAANQKYITQIEELNALLAECQKTEQALRVQNAKEKKQIMRKIDEKISNNPNPADKQLVRELSDLAEFIRSARSADSIKG